MKIQNLLLTGILMLISVASLSAQSALPNPQDDSCWSSLSALRTCQIQAYDQALAEARNCTSYPEYQCFNYYQPPKKAEVKSKAKNAGSVNAPNNVSNASATESNTTVSTRSTN